MLETPSIPTSMFSIFLSIISFQLSANKEHWYKVESDLITHLKVTIAPDGGLSRIKVFGLIENSE